MLSQPPAPRPCLLPFVGAAPAHEGADHSPRWTSQQLFGPRNEIKIEHGVAVYRLRITSLGKLILTK